MKDFLCKFDPVDQAGVELMTLSKDDLRAHIFCFHDHNEDRKTISIPSLDITMHGKILTEVIEQLQEYLIQKMHELCNLSKHEREEELASLGWIKKENYTCRYSRNCYEGMDIYKDVSYTDIALLRISRKSKFSVKPQTC